MAAILGPRGPFPDVALSDELDRRWLHYAFRSLDGLTSIVANVSTLGGSAGSSQAPQQMAILLVHDRRHGWRSSQFNATLPDTLWSSFRLPHPGARLTIGGRSGDPSIDLELTRTGHPCTSQCAPFAEDQYLRWQSEPGIAARGRVTIAGHVYDDLRFGGYHERVRGRWGWPELGGWVFGFANSPAPEGAPPAYSVVFTLIQPPSPRDAPSGSVMVWRDGRLLRQFPRRCLDVSVAGLLSPDAVEVCPPLAATLGVPPAAVVPGRLLITASMGEDRLLLDIAAETAGRIVNPSESGLLAFSVHEVLGPCTVTGVVGGSTIAVQTGAVVEFAGGARAD